MVVPTVEELKLNNAMFNVCELMDPVVDVGRGIINKYEIRALAFYDHLFSYVHFSRTGVGLE